jgi:hypothetical protein
MLEQPSLTQPIPTSNLDSSCFVAAVPLDQINTMHLCRRMSILRRTKMVLVFLQDHNGVASILRLSKDHRHKLTLHVSPIGHEALPAFNSHRNNSCPRVILTSSVMV